MDTKSLDKQGKEHFQFYNNFMFAYTYSYQSNSIVLDNGGYHQLTLGFNFGCRREKYDCKCPSVN